LVNFDDNFDNAGPLRQIGIGTRRHAGLAGQRADRLSLRPANLDQR